jgi:Glycosyl transferase family 1
MPHHLAYFISPHGFGHAARAAAVMAALQEQQPSVEFEIFTTVPEWFFRDSLTGTWNYHPVLTDIGLVQKTALQEDIAATVQQLDEFLPFSPRLVTNLVEQLAAADCELVICDIAPLGIAVAQQSAMPSVLVENFLWDWIYEGYVDEEPRLREHIGFLWHMFGMVDYHVQTEPVGVYHPADLVTRPVSRAPRTPAATVRAELGIPHEARAVLITMGGIEGQYEFLNQLKVERGVYFVIPGSSPVVRVEDNLALLPHHSTLYHPDLINASDAVVGKLGYSTVAEAYHAGVPFGYIPRPRFRESEALAEFARTRMDGIEIDAEKFESSSWLAMLPALLAQPRVERNELNGAVEVAQFIRNLLSSASSS